MPTTTATNECTPPVPLMTRTASMTMRSSLYDTNVMGNSEAPMYLVKDGMQFKEGVLLTSDWAEQPIEVLKKHIAPRWRTKPERLNIGCCTGRFATQPEDEEMCLTVGTPNSCGPTEVWLWPAPQQHQQVSHPPVVQPSQQMSSSLINQAQSSDVSNSSVFSDLSRQPSGLLPSVDITQVDVTVSATSEADSSNAESKDSPTDIKQLAARVREDGIMKVYLEDSDGVTMGIAWAESEDLVSLAAGLPNCTEDVLQAHHPQLHAAVAELLNKLPEGEDLTNLLAAMEDSIGSLLEVPALFSAAFSRMEEEQRARLLKKAVGFVLPFADRPRAGLALEACVRLQCAQGAAGGVDVVKPLLDEILTHCSTLMRSGSGNFLVQQCIQLAPSSFADSIARKIKGSAESMSLHRHASHAVEQILKFVSNPVLGDLLAELIRSSGSAARLARSQSGNYVLQTAINRCLPSMWDVVSVRIKASLPDLPSVSAERIWTKLCEKAAASNFPLDTTPNFQPAPKKTQQALPAQSQSQSQSQPVTPLGYMGGQYSPQFPQMYIPTDVSVGHNQHYWGVNNPSMSNMNMLPQLESDYSMAMSMQMMNIM